MFGGFTVNSSLAFQVHPSPHLKWKISRIKSEFVI